MTKICKKCKKEKPVLINGVCTDCGGFKIKVDSRYG
jgi:hypothetical protein